MQTLGDKQNIIIFCSISKSEEHQTLSEFPYINFVLTVLNLLIIILQIFQGFFFRKMDFKFSIVRVIGRLQYSSQYL